MENLIKALLCQRKDLLMRRQSMIQSMRVWRLGERHLERMRVQGHRVRSWGEDAQQNAGETIAEYALVEETLERCWSHLRADMRFHDVGINKIHLCASVCVLFFPLEVSLDYYLSANCRGVVVQLLQDRLLLGWQPFAGTDLCALLYKSMVVQKENFASVNHINMIKSCLYW